MEGQRSVSAVLGGGSVLRAADVDVGRGSPPPGPGCGAGCGG
jgi:hypothetical protein